MFDDLHDPTAPTATASHLAEVAVRARRLQRRRSIGLTTAALVFVAAGVVALAVLPSRDTSNVSPIPSTPATSEPLAPTTSASIATNPSTVPTPSTSTAPPSSAPERSTPDQIRDLIARIRERAATVTSFRVRVELTSTADDVPVSTAVTSVTLLADDSMWMEPIEGAWGSAGQGYFASYDPTTGISRSVIPGFDGTPTGQEIVGWNENSTGKQILLGHFPILTLDPNSDVQISDDVHDSRTVWRIEQHNGETEIVSWIDQTTGLTLRERTQSTSADPQTGQPLVNIQDSSWTNLELSVELPPAFPGVIPDGITVDRSGDPNGHITPPIAAALTTAFGPDLLLPSLRDGESIKEPSIATNDYDEHGYPVHTPGTAQGVAFTLARGFATTFVYIGWEPSAPPASLQGVETVTINDGALAGRTGTVDGTSVIVSIPGPDRTVTINVIASTVDEAVDVLTRFQPATELSY